MLRSLAAGAAVLLAAALPIRAAGGDGPGWLRPDQRLALEGSTRVAPDVVATLDQAGAARVVVALEVRDPETGAEVRRFAEPLARAELRRTVDEVLAAAGPHFVAGHRLRSLAAVTGALDVDGAMTLAAHPAVRTVAPDLPQRAFLDESLPLVGVPPLRAQGLDGAGVTVAVVDTGVDFRHKALKKARVDEHCFCSEAAGGCCPNGLEEQGGRKSAKDRNGHGTHVAGIVASRGKAHAPRGAAPGVGLVAVKVLSDSGAGHSGNTLAALDWLLTERPEVDVVNLSLGSNVLFKGVCDNKGGGLGAVYGAAVDALVDRGVLVVAASGNDGSRKKMSMPACLRGVLSVGAGFDADYAGITGSCTQLGPGPEDVACFSNRPKKLDLVAPGAFITSTKLRRGSATFAGTSMASPHVAGCAALLAQSRPDATPAELAAAMTGSGPRVTDNRGRRFPRLECEAAAAQLGPAP